MRAQRLLLISFSVAWIPANAWVTSSVAASASSALQMSSDENSRDPLTPPQSSDARRQQEMMMEEMSLKGADETTKMDVPERAKRAMLAEAVEDRIFELTEELEGLIEEDGSVSIENREKVLNLSQQTKQFQQQYNDLVNGNPSSIIDALDGTSGEA